MRPALSAREIRQATGVLKGAFNEARAFCAGNRFGRRAASFNEARAFCAGNRRRSTSPVDALAGLPSMRPALSAREIAERYRKWRTTIQ